MLLDSSVLVDLDRGGPEAQAKAERLDQEGRHAVSAVTVTELAYGVELGTVGDDEARRRAHEGLHLLLSRFEVLPVDAEVARRTAELLMALRAAGKRLDDLHDLYIAATGLVRDQTVLTANLRDLGRVQGLSVADWATY